MTTNLFLLIIWIICGVLNFISAATNEDHRVSVLNYACCWTVLIMQLIADL